MAQIKYELHKQKFIQKSGIEDCEIEAQLWPFIKEINELKSEESEILVKINDIVEELRAIVYYNEDEY